MKATEMIAAGLKQIAGAVRSVLTAAHSKKEMIDIRREKLKELSAPKEDE